MGEARALDQAAEMLDRQRLPADALTEPGEEPAGAASPEPDAQPEPVG